MKSNAADVKMIVLSQYESVLQRISTVLQDADPQTFRNNIAIVKGNVHCRSKQLDRFRSSGEGSARILLLSLVNTASGSHLAVATHVLLLDPIIDSANKGRAVDAQAIARAHRLGQTELVTVIRFIVENTIDQEDYQKTNGTLTFRQPNKSARSVFSELA